MQYILRVKAYGVGTETTTYTRTAERRFRGLLEAAPDAMVIVDADGVIQRVNAQTERLFGYSRKELLGRPVETLIPLRSRVRHVAHRQRYAANPAPRPMAAVHHELTGLRKDGREFPVEISLSPLESREGLLMSAAIRDVTDRKLVERKLNELAVIVESSQDAIFAETLDGVITFWNQAAERLYGYTAAEMIGRHTSILAPPDRADEVETLLGRLARGERVERLETVRLAADGRLLDVEMTLSPVTSDGEVTGISAIARDIGERRQAREELTRLYNEQRHVALTLQRSLMGTPPQIPGIRTASRYRPATEGFGVGGDWFDVISVSPTRVGVVIGDVMGRGLEAAAVMGQLRAAAHALAKTGMPPWQLMRTLDAVVCDLPDQLVTCCYLLIDRETCEVSVCSAGHLPVLLVVAGEPVRPLRAPVGVPLGVSGHPHHQAAVKLPPGSTIVLYTDGLVESRVCDLDLRIMTLTAELERSFAAGLDLETTADRVLSTLLPGTEGTDDDVTLLLAQVDDGDHADMERGGRGTDRRRPVAAGRSRGPGAGPG